MNASEIWDKFIVEGVEPEELLKVHIGSIYDNAVEERDPSDPSATEITKSLLTKAFEDAIWLTGLQTGETLEYYITNTTGVEIVVLQGEEGPTVAYRIQTMHRDHLWRIGDPEDVAADIVNWYTANVDRSGEYIPLDYSS